MDTLLIESSRQSAVNNSTPGGTSNINKFTQNLTKTIATNSWNTNIPSGIPLVPGDQISLESASVNILGAGESDFLTFRGKSNVKTSDNLEITDNKAQAEISYYVTNNCQFNFNLPSGTHMITDGVGGRGFNNTNFGTVDLTGKHLWGINFAQGIAFPQSALLASEAKWDQQQFGMDRNCAFYQGQNAEITIPGLPTATGPDAGVIALGELCGYAAWIQSVPYHGLPGTYFNQNQNVNMNIENRDTCPFVQDQSSSPSVLWDLQVPNSATAEVPFIQGGASPYQVLNQGPQNTEVVLYAREADSEAQFGNYKYSNRTGGTVAVPKSKNDYITRTTQFLKYNDLINFEAARFKGGYTNYKPNSIRLYCSEMNTSTLRNFGPLYNIDVNPVVKPQNNVEEPNFKNVPRDTHYFNKMTKIIDFELPTGNISSSRIGEVLTNQLKLLNEDSTDFLDNSIFLTTRDSDVTIIKKELESLKSKTMMEYPTMTGLCLNSKWKYEGQTTDYNWSVTELEQDASKCGAGYKTNEALNKFYQNMLVGNPPEWRLITEVLPQLQFGPMDLSTLPAANANLNDILKFYTMVTGGFDKSFTAPAALVAPGNAPRKMPSNNIDTTKYSVGEFGCFPCIIHATALHGTLSSENIYAFSSMYAVTENSNTSVPAGQPAGAYDINSLSGGVRMVYTKRESADSGFKTLNVTELDLMVTNIIFDGQVPNKLLNENAERIQKHHESSATNNTVDNDYLNNTYVDWVIGRIDDQRTYPENHAILSDSLTGPLPTNPYLTGVVGTPVYVPNIFQTYKLFNGNPAKYLDDTHHGTQSVGDINSILVDGVRDPQTPQIGSYVMINQPNGLPLGSQSGTHTEYPATPWRLPTTHPYRNNGDFGLPCLSTYSNSYNENNDGFKSNVLRTIKGYRYLPQGKAVEYNAINAYNEQIPMGNASAIFSTRPERLTFTQLQALWDSIENLNNSKGVGWIPVFYKINTNPSSNVAMLDVPLLAMIVNEASNDLPYPETGEYFFMGSPSLSQNILAFPTSTQQTSFQTNPTKSEPNRLVGSSSTRTDPTTQYNQPYVGVNNWTGYESVNAGVINMPTAQTPVLPPNIIPDIPTFSTVVLPTDEFVKNGTFGNSGYSLSTTINAGASDPLIDFNQNFNRFAISNFHTPSFKGNGVFQLGNFGPSSNPETIQKILNSRISAFSQQVDLPVFYFTKKYDSTAWDPDDSASVWKVYKTDAPYLTGTQRDLYSPGEIGYESTGTPPPIIADPCAGFQPLQAQSIDGNCIYCTLGPRSIDSTGQNMGTLIDNNSEPGGLMRQVDKWNFLGVSTTGNIDSKIELDSPIYKIDGGYIPAVGNTVYFVTSTNIFYQGVINYISPGTGTKRDITLSVYPQIAYDGSTAVNFNISIQYYENVISTNYLGNPQYMSPFNGTQGNIRGGALRDDQGFFYDPFPSTSKPTGPTTEQASLQSGNVTDSARLLFHTLKPFAYIKQDDLKSEKNYATSSQSGIALEKINLITKSGSAIEVDSYDKELFNGSLFNKLGYDIDQLIPFAGKPSNMYNNQLYNSNTKLTSRIFDSQRYCVKPFTTNSFMDTSSIPSLVSMFGTSDATSSKNVVNTTMPAFNLGSIRASAATTAQSDILPARNLVQKFNVPNFLLKSNIISACSQQFIGGINGRTMLPVVAPLNTNYAVGDYIYVSRSDLVFQVTKDSVLTDITSEITYPDGTTTEDILAEDSSVIYRIDFNVEERNRRIFEEEQEKVKKEKITKNK